MSSIRSRLTYANVASSIALFMAVATGGAYAVNTIGSADVIDESLLSQDIKNGQIMLADLATDSVSSGRIVNGTITDKDLAADSVTAAAIKAGNVGTSELAGGAITKAKLGTGSVNSDKIADGSVGLPDIDQSSFDLSSLSAAASDSYEGCSADDHVPTECFAATIDLGAPGRVHVAATGSWHTFQLDDLTGTGSDTDDATLVRGRCYLTADGEQIGSNQAMGEIQPAEMAASHPFDAPGTLALTALSGVLTAGSHSVGLTCTEEDGDIDWGNMNLTAELVDDPGAAPIRAHRRAKRG